jgi:hypothetical protein
LLVPYTSKLSPIRAAAWERASGNEDTAFALAVDAANRFAGISSRASAVEIATPVTDRARDLLERGCWRGNGGLATQRRVAGLVRGLRSQVRKNVRP